MKNRFGQILTFPFWKTNDSSVTQSPPESFMPSSTVIIGYGKDIEKYGVPLDSGLPDYFRKCADYFEKVDHDK